MSRNPRHPRRLAGFSLIELVIFLVLIAVTGAMIAPMFSSVLTGAHRPKLMVQADYLAMGKIEQALASRARPSAGYAGLVCTDDTVTLGTTTFDRACAVTTLAPGTAPCPAGVTGCKTVTVNVSSGGGNYASATTLVIAP